MTIDLDEIHRVRREADCLVTAATLAAVYDGMAAAMSTTLAESNPILLPIMNGGLYLCGQLLPRLDFPLELGYLHATRYRGGLTGGDELVWQAGPDEKLRGRTVVVIDDILDAGVTLQQTLAAIEAVAPARVYSAVLVIKDRPRRAEVAVDFAGVTVPDRYVFGCGMDYKEYWRNLPAIYAVAGA